MSSIAFTPIRTGNELVDRNLDALKDVVNRIVAAIPSAPTFGLWVVNGSNGIGPIALPPIRFQRNPSAAIFQRATVGSRVIGVVQLTTAFGHIQTDFETVLSHDDQIQQLVTNNLSTQQFLVIVVN